MNRENLRRVNFLSRYGVKGSGFFHKWLVVNGGVIVALVEDEDGGMHSVLIERIRFID